MNIESIENIDMTRKVADSVVTYLGAGGILIVSAIFVLLFIFIKRYKSSIMPLFMGILAYVVFGFLGYTILTSAIVSIPGIRAVYENNATTVVIMFTIILVLLYTVARIITMHVLKDKLKTPGDVFTAGLGLGLCEAVLYGFTILALTTWCAGINSQGLQAIFEGFSQEQVSEQYIIETYSQISGLFESPSELWLLLGISYVMDIIVNVGLMMIHNGVLSEKLPKMWYGIAIIMNFITVLPFKIYDGTSASNIWTMFGIKVIAVAACLYVVYMVDRNYLGSMLKYDAKAGISKASISQVIKRKK